MRGTVGIFTLLWMLGLNWMSQAQELFLKKVTVTDGLLGYDNYGMLEDANGAIWICSENGVVRLEGNKYRRFTSTDGLYTNDIWHMAVDPNGRIWLRSYAAGIQYIYNDTVYTVKNSRHFDEVQYSGFHRDTCFFSIRVNGDLKRYYLSRDGTLKHYKRFVDLGFEVKGDFSKHGFLLLSKLIHNQEEDFYYFLDSKKIEATNARFLNMNYREFVDEAPVFRCYSGKARENSELAIFVPTNGGFKPILKHLWDDATFRNVYHFDNKHFVINVKGKAQVFTANKIETRKTDVEQILKNNFDLPTDIGGVIQDKNGNLWVLHLRGELYFIHNSAFWATHLDFKNKWNTEIFQPISLQKEGQFLYFNYKGEICFYNYLSGERKVLYKYNGAIREIKLLQNELYVLQPNGIVVLTIDQTLESVEVKKSKLYLFNSEIGSTALAFDFVDSTRLILSSGYFIELLPNLQVKSEKIDNFNSLFRTEKIILINDLIACCSNTKCYFFDLKSKKEIKVAINSPSCIRYVQGNLFIGTFGNGCYILDLTTQKLIHVFDSKEDVLNILYNDALYFCTSNGIIVGQIQNNVFRATKSHFNQEYFSLRVNDIIIGRNLIVLTNRGVVVIDTDKRSKFFENDRIYSGMKFTISAKNMGKKIVSGAIVGYNQNVIGFTLQDDAFFNISSTIYRYKLDGNSTKWLYTKNGTITLSNLRAGEYKLVVESSFSKYGIFKNQKTFNFQISKPFYTNQYFILGSILFALVFLVTINYIVRLFAFKKAQRTAKLKELEYQALQAQLNPHFVFNCLNNLQRMMILSDEQEVNEYICSFAGLMRNVLDNSKKKKITLSEEIELLENYLRIERIRLAGSLRYSILLSEDIDPTKIEVYGMVFQPFVENAIIHGFMTNQDDKQITVSFVIIESNILFGTVIDNGIGRDKSHQLKKKGLYKSWASTILKEKSELLNISRKNELSFEIIDLYSNNLAIGTKVEVKMRID